MRTKAYILIITLILIQCDPMDGRLTIVNGSKDTIFVFLPPNGKIEEYPVKLSKGDTLWDHTRYILPGGESHPLSFGLNSWENSINRKYRDSTLTIFIFDKKLLKGIAPENLLRQQIYTKKYSYKVKDLEKLSWRVEYR
jgi:hypothetical protein